MVLGLLGYTGHIKVKVGLNSMNASVKKSRLSGLFFSICIIFWAGVHERGQFDMKW